MIIRIIPNIFDRSTVQEHKAIFQGLTAGRLFDASNVGARENFAAVVGGGEVGWDYVPTESDDITFVNKLGYGVDWVAVGAFLLEYVLPAVIGAALGYAMSLMFAPSVPGQSQNGLDKSKTYSWDGIKNIVGEGNPMPVIYGTHRMGGIVLEAFLNGDSQSGTQKRKYLNVLLGVSEGPIHGVQESTIKIDNKDLSYYEGAADYWTRLGAIDQSPIENFSKVARHYAMTSTVNLTQGSGYVYRTFSDVDAVTITILIPNMFWMDDEDGDMMQNAVDLRIDYSPDQAVPDWHTYRQVDIKGRTKSPFEHDVTLDMTGYGGRGKYLFRITRLSDDWDADPARAGATQLKSVTEWEHETCAYVNTALFGVRLKATDKLSGAMPTFTAVVDGRILTDVRGYTPSIERSKNPANQVYDLLTNVRYGMGRYGITDANIDMGSLRAFADWADELIVHKWFNRATGLWETKSEKRYEFNFVLDTQQKASDVISKICSSCRVMVFWQGSKIKFVIEKPQSTYAQVFNMGNIVKDSFSEEYVSWGDIPNEIEATITDATNDYKRQPVVAIDKSRLDEPVISNQINLFGFTDIARAKRELIFALKKPHGARKKVAFKASIQAVVCEPGDLILFQHDIPQYGFGGNLNSLDLDVSGNGQLGLDRDVPVVAGRQYRLRVRRKNGQYFIHDFTPLTTTTLSLIDVTAAPADLEKGDLWLFGEVGKEGKPFIVYSITHADDKTYKLMGVEYNESIFIEDDRIEVTEVNYSALGMVARYDVDGSVPYENQVPTNEQPQTPDNPDEAPPLVLNVQAFEELTLQGDVWRPDIVVNFTPVEMPDNSLSRIVRYDIIYSIDDGVSWQVHGSTTGTGYYRITGVEVGQQYYIHVKPYTNYGRTNYIELGSHALDNGLLIMGDVTGPSAPGSLVVTGETLACRLTWNNPPERDVDRVEIWRATQNNRAYAVRVGAVAKTPSGILASRFLDGGLHQTQTYWYWLVAYDTSGNESPWYPGSPTAGVSCTPSNDPAQLLSLLTGSITSGQLTADLNTAIDGAAEVASEMTLVKNQWTLKIAENETIVGAGLLLYLDWDVATAYEADDYVFHNGAVYRCLTPHTGSAPPSAYWTLVPYGAKSEFIIQADKFAIVQNDGSGTPNVPFIVGNIGGVASVGVNGALIVDGTINAQNVIAHGTIDGQHIMAQAQLVLAEGGSATFGNQNVIINTSNDGTPAKIIVSPDGGPVDGNNYTEISEDEINQMYWNPVTMQHELYRGIGRMEFVTVESGATVQVPGIWKEAPRVMMGPALMPIYDPTYPDQKQTLYLADQNMRNQVDGLGTPIPGKYQFDVLAQLRLGQTVNGVPGGPRASYLTCPSNIGLFPAYVNSTTFNLPVNVKALTVNATIWGSYGRSWTWETSEGEIETGNDRYRANFRARLYYYTNGAWLQANLGPYTLKGSDSPKSITFTVSSAYVITQFYLRVIFDGNATLIFSSTTAYPGYGCGMDLKSISYVTDQAATVVPLATGTVNCLIIGR